MQLSNKQIDPTIAFVENARQSWETHWAMGKVKFVSKKFKNFRFFRPKLAEFFFAKNITTHRSIEWFSID